MERNDLSAIHYGIHNARRRCQGHDQGREVAVHWSRVPDVYIRNEGLWSEIQMSEDQVVEIISEDYMKRIRRLADNRPEVIMFILEDLMSHLLNEEEKGRIIRGAFERWVIAGRET